MLHCQFLCHVLKALIFIKIALKLLFLQKNAKFSSAGGSAPRPPKRSPHCKFLAMRLNASLFDNDETSFRPYFYPKHRLIHRIEVCRIKLSKFFYLFFSVSVPRIFERFLVCRTIKKFENHRFICTKVGC